MPLDGRAPACEWHEERISRNETALTAVTAQMAALNEQVKNVGKQVEEVGERLGEALKDFRESNDEAHAEMKADIESLRETQTAQAESIKVLLADHEGRSKRLDLAKKSGLWVLVAVLGAIATKWGEALYEFFTKAKG